MDLVTLALSKKYTDDAVSGTGSFIRTSEKGAANGVAELDSNGLVPTLQLPSYVDDVLEGTAQGVSQTGAGTYSATGFILSGESEPATLEEGKTYVDISTNIQYRFTGSILVSMGSNLTLGETMYSAYRGDRGKTAYDHATDENKLTTATNSGLYKVASTSQGHIASLTAVVKEDITNLGIPAQDTVYDDTELSNRVTELENEISLLKKKVYGMRITGNAESDPASKITYLEDAVGMTPAYMDYTTDKFNFGSWADAWFMDGIKPCVLKADGTVYCYLDRNDQTKDVDGNDVTDIVNGTTDFGQNCMVEWPKIWIKTIPVEGDDTSGLVYIAPMKLDDDYHDFPYIDQNGNHKEHFYRPMYNGSVKNGVMRSLLGQQVSKNLNATTEISYCQANGDGWYTETAGEIMLVNFLLMLISKSTDTQTVFGKGLSENGSEEINDAFRTGVHSDKGMFYGTKSAEASTYTNAVKVFYTENDWGFQWRRYAGDINASGTRKVKMCWGTEDDSTVVNYNTDGTGYVDVGVTPSGTSGGYINEMKFTSLGMFSKTSSGSSSTHYCDGQWFNNNQTDYAVRGGASGGGARVGAFCVRLDSTSSVARWADGAALSYK